MSVISGDEVVHGARPKPFMVYKNLDILDIPQIQSVVKVIITYTFVLDMQQLKSVVNAMNIL